MRIALVLYRRAQKSPCGRFERRVFVVNEKHPLSYYPIALFETEVVSVAAVSCIAIVIASAAPVSTAPLVPFKARVRGKIRI